MWLRAVAGAGCSDVRGEYRERGEPDAHYAGTLPNESSFLGPKHNARSSIDTSVVEYQVGRFLGDHHYRRARVAGGEGRHDRAVHDSVTGRKALYVNPGFTTAIVGMPDEESQSDYDFSVRRHMHRTTVAGDVPY